MDLVTMLAIRETSSENTVTNPNQPESVVGSVARRVFAGSGFRQQQQQQQ